MAFRTFLEEMNTLCEAIRNEKKKVNYVINNPSEHQDDGVVKGLDPEELEEARIIELTEQVGTLEETVERLERERGEHLKQLDGLHRKSGDQNRTIHELYDENEALRNQTSFITDSLRESFANDERHGNPSKSTSSVARKLDFQDTACKMIPTVSIDHSKKDQPRTVSFKPQQLAQNQEHVPYDEASYLTSVLSRF